MQFEQNGITLIASDDWLRQIVLERLAAERTIRTAADEITDPAPRIGEDWTAQGGVYSGIARGRDGARDHHLIIGPEYPGTLDYDAMLKWLAELQAHGFHDYTWMYRPELALAYANVPELFSKDTPYWSGEQPASYSDNAWYQFFDNGDQDYATKDTKLRARAVRRLPIQ